MTPKNDIREALTFNEDLVLEDIEIAEREEEEVFGQLAVDIYQTETELVVKAPIAGVDPKDLDLTVTDEMIAIKGVRKDETEAKNQGYHTRECYWGGFFRSETFPVLVAPDKAVATFKNGILTVRIPKASHSKLRKIKISTD